jgi:hypothetical protein
VGPAASRVPLVSAMQKHAGGGVSSRRQAFLLRERRLFACR